MTNTVKSDRFVLKVLDQRSFEIVVEIVLEKDIKCLYDDIAVRGTMRRENIPRKVDLCVTASSKLLANIVSPVEAAII
jgi:hypothetical protein